MPVSPPTVGLSFGSFGDIVTVLQLAWQLYTALDRSAGASAELRALAGDVDVVMRALQDVETNIDCTRPVSPQLRDDITATLSRCRDALLEIQRRIDRAQRQTSQSGWRRFWGSAVWSILGGKKDVEALCKRVNREIGMIQLYLALCGLNPRNSPQRVPDGVAGEADLKIDIPFMFFAVNGSAYPPFAHTSLDRLREVYDTLWRGDNNLSSWLSDGYGITEDDFRVRTGFFTKITISIGFRGHGTICTECYFFRNNEKSVWHVFVGGHDCLTAEKRVLKSLLEGTHTVVADTTSASYGIAYQGVTNDFIRHLEAAQLFSEVVRLLLDRQHPGCSRPGWLDGLVDLFYECTDPEPLRSIVLPTLLQQRHMSADETFDLISGVLKPSRLPSSSVGTSTNQAPEGLDFRAYSRALVELLVRHALPLSASSQAWTAPFPDWVYGRPNDTVLTVKNSLKTRGSFDSIIDMYT